MHVELSSTLFRDLDETAVAAVLDSARQRHCKPKEPFCRQGDMATSLFVLTSGLAKLSGSTPSGAELILDWIAPGGVFGLGAVLFTPRKSLWTVTAVKVSDGLEWEHDVVSHLAARWPRFHDNILRIALEWGDHLQARLEQLSIASVESRLAQLLLHLDTRFKSEGQGEIQLSDEELGQMSRSTLFTVNKVLNRWRRMGYVEKRRRRLLIVDSSSLQRISLYGSKNGGPK